MTAKTVRVRFVDIGRNKQTWEVDVKAQPAGDLPDERSLLRALHARGALRSRDLDVSVDGSSGLCFAGMHTVGRWEVVHAAGT